MTPFVIVTGDFVDTGGMDYANYALARYMAGHGIAVHLVAHRVGEELQRQSTVTVHRVGKPLSSYFMGSPLLDRAGQRLARKVTANGGRVVVNGGNCNWGDINWVHYVHAAYEPEFRAGSLHAAKGKVMRNIYLRQERRNLQKARIIIANSHRTKTDIVDRLGVSADRVHVVYYGTDPDRFRPAGVEERVAQRKSFGWPSDAPVVTFIGALGDRRKGFDLLFDAWKMLCEKSSWDANLMVVGTGAELSAWKSRAASSGMADRISFLGFRRDVPNILAASDAVVAPTRYEAYGLGVHEALCCGLPAIVSAGAGVAERYAPELKSLLVPDGADASELARTIAMWRQNVDQYRAAAQPLAQELRTYTWDTMASRILDVVQRN